MPEKNSTDRVKLALVVDREDPLTSRGELGAPRGESQLAPASPPTTARDPLAAYLGRLARGASRNSMARALGQLARQIAKDESATAATFPWVQLRYGHVTALRSYLADHYAPRTANKLISAIRGVMEEGFNLGLVPPDEWTRIRGIKGVKGSRVQKGRALTPAEIDRLLVAAASMPAGARARAIVVLFYAAGLRRFELSGLTLADVDLAGQVVTVLGKRNKQRRVPIGPEAAAELVRWLVVRGRDPGPLFPATAPNGAILKRPMSPHSVYTVIRRLGAAAGVTDFGTHDFRRTFAGDMLDAGADLVAVQRLMGHESPQTTAGYDRREERTLKAAVAKRPLNFSG